MKRRCYKTCLGYVKCIVSIAAHNAILKNWVVQTKFLYLSSISSLYNIRVTKLKLKLFLLIGQICKCSNLYVHNYYESNRNERKLQKK